MLGDVCHLHRFEVVVKILCYTGYSNDCKRGMRPDSVQTLASLMNSTLVDLSDLFSSECSKRVSCFLAVFCVFAMQTSQNVWLSGKYGETQRTDVKTTNIMIPKHASVLLCDGQRNTDTVFNIRH